MFSVREPFYFYHLLPDNVRLNKDGIVSPKYWFRKGDIIQYLKCVDKYRVRLCKDWKIYPNLKPEDLTPIQIYNGLNIFRNDKDGNVAINFGKASFTEKKLTENLKTVIDTIIKIKPAVVKGTYILNCAISSTYGPSIKISI